MSNAPTAACRAEIPHAAEQSRTIVEAAGDDEGAMNDALIRLVQEKAFSALVEMGELESVDFIDMGHMVAKLGKTAVAQNQRMAKVKEKGQAAAAKVENVARKGGPSDEAVQAIRREILGVVG